MGDHLFVHHAPEHDLLPLQEGKECDFVIASWRGTGTTLPIAHDRQHRAIAFFWHGPCVQYEAEYEADRGIAAERDALKANLAEMEAARKEAMLPAEEVAVPPAAEASEPAESSLVTPRLVRPATPPTQRWLRGASPSGMCSTSTTR